MNKRSASHSSEIYPSIWHENKAGNVNSHPFSCALRAGASYNYLLVNGKRRLTPHELLRLQGFPDNFKIVVPYGQIRKQTGNAVPVNVVQAVLEKMLPLLHIGQNGNSNISDDTEYYRINGRQKKETAQASNS